MLVPGNGDANYIYRLNGHEPASLFGGKMKFFKPEDFAWSTEMIDSVTWEDAAAAANAKLEREGKVVYGTHPNGSDWWNGPMPMQKDCYKAFLINIEPIAKCEHPSEKVRTYQKETHVVRKGYDDSDVYSTDREIVNECECGAREKPKSFEVVE